MFSFPSRRWCFGLPVLVCLWGGGCGGNSTPQTTAEGNSRTANESSRNDAPPPPDGLRSASSESPSFQPLNLRAASSKGGHADGSGAKESRVDSVLDAMQPLQEVLIGTWRGVTRKSYGGFKATDELQWKWDFQTNSRQPALVMTSDASPYIRSGRLTFLTDEQVYQFEAVDPDGETRSYQGAFAEPVRDVPGDGDNLQRTYKLELTQAAGPEAEETWRIVFNQQENNRYLLELYRKRAGGDFLRFDTVSTQRKGTSFAVSDTDYGEKTCIISQGLGTIQVSHEGKTYWVCCSGCKAAFEDDPEKHPVSGMARQPWWVSWQLWSMRNEPYRDIGVLALGMGAISAIASTSIDWLPMWAGFLLGYLPVTALFALALTCNNMTKS